MVQARSVRTHGQAGIVVLIAVGAGATVPEIHLEVTNDTPDHARKRPKCTYPVHHRRPLHRECVTKVSTAEDDIDGVRRELAGDVPGERINE